MRNYLLLTLTALNLMYFSGVYSQKNFAPLGAEWKYYQQCYEIYPNSYLIILRVENEIIIDGKDCSIISAYEKENQYKWMKSEDSLVVYEDLGKVYFLNVDTFLLLFDFTAKVGDTINYYYPINKIPFASINPNMGAKPILQRATITKIDSVQFGSSPRKRMMVYPILDGHNLVIEGSWIEGIGSTSSRFAGQASYYVADCWGGFSCYGYQDTFYSSQITDCDFTSATNEEIISHKVNIIPNPVSSEFTISGGEISMIKILDLNGRSVLTLSNNSGTMIDVQALPNGLYLVDMLDGLWRHRVEKMVKL